MRKTPLELRFENSIRFLNKHALKDDKILDLGDVNKLSKLISEKNFSIVNTEGQDLDLMPESLRKYKDIDIVTAFEILEHLVSPFPLLQDLPTKRLIATVPLRLWFATAYRNKNNVRDQHFHEFEDWQFDWLLEKAGWRIIDREKWKNPSEQIGIRPFLRSIYPRYYAVYAERI